MPSTVQKINQGAVAYCHNLERMVFLGDAPSFTPLNFYDRGDKYTVYYLSEASGFSNPWHSRETVIMDDFQERLLAMPGSARFSNELIKVESDADGDGFNNHAEYQFGRDPFNGSEAHAFSVGDLENNKLWVTFYARENVVNMEFVLQTTTDWQDGWTDLFAYRSRGEGRGFIQTMASQSLMRKTYTSLGNGVYQIEQQVRSTSDAAFYRVITRPLVP